MKKDKEYKSYIRIHFIIWFLLIVIISMLIATNYTSSILNLFNVIVFYFLWIITITLYKSHKIVKYIKKYYSEIWRKYKTNPILQYWKWRDFFKSSNDSGDKHLKIIKNDIKKMRLLLWLNFLSFGIVKFLVLLIVDIIN